MTFINQEDQSPTNELSASSEFITLPERVLSQVQLGEIISTKMSPGQICNAILSIVTNFPNKADERDEDNELVSITPELPELESTTPVPQNLSITDSSSPSPEPVEDDLTTCFDKRRLQLNKDSYFICIPCGRNFGTKGSYTQHRRAHHSGPLAYRCEVCGKRFELERKMKAHQVRHSIQDKPFKCDDCPKQFLYKHDLNRHKSKHHASTAAVMFDCEVCGSKFNRQDLLAMHQIKHGRTDNDQ